MKRIKDYSELYKRKLKEQGNIVIPQRELDLDSKRKPNPFAYRGQFSPDLVNTLIKYYGRQGDYIFDPFLGCGTLIYEAMSKGLYPSGSEINPFAIYMSRLSLWAKYSCQERKKMTKSIMNGMKNILLDYEKLVQYARAFPEGASKDFMINMLMNLKKDKMSVETTQEKFYEMEAFILELPFYNGDLKILHSDARDVKIPDNSVDLVITSPPYINVFNYHQNGRELMEAFEWDILGIARSEIGSNRKNRQNRFHTVTQYILEMSEVLSEASRYVKGNGKLIFVVGKETTVRFSKFRNGEIIAVVGMVQGLSIDNVYTRTFKNKFGHDIVEEIIVFDNPSAKMPPVTGQLNDVAEFYLKEALKTAKNSDIYGDIVEAIEKVNNIKMSPLLKF